MRRDREEADERDLEQQKRLISMQRMLVATATENIVKWLSKEEIKLPRTPDEVILHWIRGESLVPEVTEEDRAFADPFFGLKAPEPPPFDLFDGPPPW